MDEQGAQQECDVCLRPFLQATDGADEEHLLARLVSEDAEPIIRQLIRKMVRAPLAYEQTSAQKLDLEDIFENVYGDVLVRLLKRLRELKTDPNGMVISNFRGYVATTTYNACYAYLRQKYPQRLSAKNKLRYLLTHHQDLALWKSDDQEEQQLCGLAEWRGRKRSGEASKRLEKLRDNPRPFIEEAGLEGADLQRVPAQSLKALFRWAGGPLELEPLVTVMVELWGVKDQPLESYDKDGHSFTESLVDPQKNISSLLEMRQLLKHLWEEICQLPPRQRAVLLLNLRDAEGRDLINIFPLTRTATIEQIGEALGIPPSQFALMWQQLPFDDATIADRLALTRQQVIKLRWAARQRLSRRMKKVGISWPFFR